MIPKNLLTEQEISFLIFFKNTTFKANRIMKPVLWA
jgi:hypothetical protein